MSFLAPYTPQAYALMRMVAGFLFLWHGSQKVFGFPPMPGDHEAPAFIIWTAGPIELLGGLLVMLGIFTRFAAFLSSGLMGVAYWMAHGMNALLPIDNHGEPAALYCFVFLFIACYGPGIWSVDGEQ